MNLVPITVQDAREFVRQHHRHHPPPVSGLFAVACSEDGGSIVGVAIALLARELEARRLDGSNVESIETARRKRR